MVYLENVITLSKLMGLLFLFCLPLLSILFLKTKRKDHARPVMGTIFLVYHAKSRLNTPVWGSLRSPNYVGMSRMSNELRRRNYMAHANAQSHFRAPDL